MYEGQFIPQSPRSVSEVDEVGIRSTMSQGDYADQAKKYSTIMHTVDALVESTDEGRIRLR